MKSNSLFSTTPIADGLYNPANEHDACGVAMVATLNKLPTHEIVSQALTALRNLDSASLLIDEAYKHLLES